MTGDTRPDAEISLADVQMVFKAGDADAVRAIVGRGRYLGNLPAAPDQPLRTPDCFLHAFDAVESESIVQVFAAFRILNGLAACAA